MIAPVVMHDVSSIVNIMMNAALRHLGNGRFIFRCVMLKLFNVWCHI